MHGDLSRAALGLARGAVRVQHAGHSAPGAGPRRPTLQGLFRAIQMPPALPKHSVTWHYASSGAQITHACPLLPMASKARCGERWGRQRRREALCLAGQGPCAFHSTIPKLSWELRCFGGGLWASSVQAVGRAAKEMAKCW